MEHRNLNNDIDAAFVDYTEQGREKNRRAKAIARREQDREERTIVREGRKPKARTNRYEDDGDDIDVVPFWEVEKEPETTDVRAVIEQTYIPEHRAWLAYSRITAAVHHGWIHTQPAGDIRNALMVLSGTRAGTIHECDGRYNVFDHNIQHEKGIEINRDSVWVWSGNQDTDDYIGYILKHREVPCMGWIQARCK